MTKLRNNRGETLIEVLASVLTVALSLALLFSYIQTSYNIESPKTQAIDEAHYNAINGAEHGDLPINEAGTGWSIRITDRDDNELANIDVNMYGGDGVFSYRGSES